MDEKLDRPADERRVALIKSLATNNRFYALVDPASGLRNADTVEHIPDDLILGIAYPCLEDGLNDFSVIRTTFETLDFFPDDADMRQELGAIIRDAQSNLVKRIIELRDCIGTRRAYFLGTDLGEFKAYALDFMYRGCPRRHLDSMMKVNVFGSVATTEGYAEGSEPPYCYEVRDGKSRSDLGELPGREFLSALFSDVLESVQDEENYQSKYTFDRDVFQKYIALMFINYATTEPIFYGTHKADYGVASDKDMESTPLYRAIARELRHIENMDSQADYNAPTVTSETPCWPCLQEDYLSQVPQEIISNEKALLGPLAALCAAAQQLQKNAESRADHETQEFTRIILANASQLVEELKRLNILSPLAYDPGSPDLDVRDSPNDETPENSSL